MAFGWLAWIAPLAGAAPEGTADALSLPAQVYTLDNGMIVLLLEDHRTDTVALHVTYGVGSRDEQAGEKGCAHLFEHLMFEGSKNVGPNKFDQWLTLAGGENNAYTSNDVTAYHMTFPSGALDLALFLESDRLGFLDSGLTQENLDNQQLVVLQERNEGYAEPNGRDWDTLSRLMYPADHPYHTPVIGTVADIEGFTVEGTTSFWRRHYQPSNAVLALVGNFESAAALDRVKYWFSDLPKPEVPVDPRQTGAPPANPARSNAVIEDDVEERSLYLAWHTVPREHPDMPALDLLSYVLSNGRGTRLDDALYFESKKSTGVFTFASFSDLTGEFLVGGSSDKTKLPKLAAAMRDEIAGVVASPPTDAELTRARKSARADFLDPLEYPANKAETLVDCYRETGEADCLPKTWSRYEAVTVADLVRVTQKYLVDAEPWTLSNVPRGDADSALEGAVVVELP